MSRVRNRMNAGRFSASSNDFEQDHQQSAKLRHHAGMTTDRLNTKLAAADDQAEVIRIELGPRAAATFLEAQGAGFALICRVLVSRSDDGLALSFRFLNDGGSDI